MPRTKEGHARFIDSLKRYLNGEPERTDDAPSIVPRDQKPMFGGCLEDAVDTETGASLFVVWCVRAIETTGDNLKTDELYKKFGENDQVKEIMNTAEKDMQEKLENEENVHVLTGALKLFFEELEETFLDALDFRHLFQQSVGDCPDFCTETKKAIASFEVVHQETLKYIMKHLNEVLKHSASNNASVESLVLAFRPVFMSLDFIHEHDLSHETHKQITLIEHLLNDYEKIFTA